MKPVRTKTTNVTYTAEGCNDLPATTGSDAHGPFIITAWEPDESELANFNMPNARVVLTTRGRAQPPVHIDLLPGPVN